MRLARDLCTRENLAKIFPSHTSTTITSIMLTPSQNSLHVFVGNLGRCLTPLVIVLALFSQSAKSDEWDQPSLGCEMISLEQNQQILKQFGKMPAKGGLLVMAVSPGSPADVGGLKPLNVITHINRKPVGDGTELRAVLATMAIGDAVSMAGYGLTPKNVWKPGTIKAKVITRRESLLGFTEKTRDAVHGTEFLSHVDAPKITRTPQLELYIAVVDESPRLKIRVSHIDQGWIFARNLVVKIHDQTITIPLPIDSRDTDVWGGGKTAEVFTLTVEGDLLEHVKTIAGARPTIIRIDGKDGVADREMEIDEFKRFGRMLDVFESMKNQ
jgi:hypothetical protein